MLFYYYLYLFQNIKKNFILIIKNNYVFNIIKTTILESINANLEIQKFKKVNFELRKSNFAIRKDITIIN